jgi:hypothetical protein
MAKAGHPSNLLALAVLALLFERPMISALSFVTGSRSSGKRRITVYSVAAHPTNSGSATAMGSTPAPARGRGRNRAAELPHTVPSAAVCVVLFTSLPII